MTDIVMVSQVHRLLLAAVEKDRDEEAKGQNSATLPGSRQLEEMADHMNTKHRVGSRVAICRKTCLPACLLIP